MKTLKFFIAILCLVAGFSCESDKEGSKKGVPGEMTFSVSTENVVDGPAVDWQTDDAISIFDGKSNNEFSTTDSGQTASFSGSANTLAKEFMALYPYVNGIGRYSGKVFITLPASQVAVKDGFAPESNIAVAYSRNNDGKVLNFKNMCAFLKIKLEKADDVAAVQVESKNGEPLAGAVKVGLFEEPTIEADTKNASSIVALTGDALDGEFYLAVIPQTLTGGYKLTLTSSDELKYTVEVSAETQFERNHVYDLGAFSKVEWVAAVNPNPTKIPSLNLIKASFTAGEFNIVSEPGFEAYPTKPIGYRSSWRPHTAATAITGHSGSVAVKTENPTPGVWFDALLQTVALRPNTDYTYSVWVQGGTPHNYTGVRCFPGNLGQEIAGPTWSPTSTWTQISRDFNTGANFYGDVFCGLWGDAGAFFSVDDVKLIPKGYTAKSMDPTTYTVSGDISNTSFDAITKLGKVVTWKGTNGKIMFALSDLTVNGKHYDNALAYTDAENLSGKINLTRFIKKSGVLAPIIEPASGEISIVPNAAFTIGTKTYLHYYAKASSTDANTWTSSRAGFLVSEDSGKTWTASTKRWSGSGSFVEASFCQKDGYIYMVGSKSGRTASYWSNMYVARILSSKDFTDPTQWDYWNGSKWSTGDESVCSVATCCLTTGGSGESALVYNAKFSRFMMIYRSGIHQGLVYRDADTIDGFWSGEKPFTDDDVAGVSYAPSVIEVTSTGDLLMIVPQL